jgi:LysM repeat protein/ABC-type branched-subunit amino acid transport system substrate-binding protein
MGIGLKTVLIFFLLALGTSTVAQADSTRLHEVKAKETKYGIARQYNITIEELESFNPEIKEGLRMGTTLLIPPANTQTNVTKSDTARQDSGFYYHRVKARETLYSLSRDYGVGILEIRKNNPLVDKEGLKIDMLVKIPISDKAKVDALQPAQEYYLHLVLPKETAYSLAQKYNLSLDSLYLLNPKAELGLQIGQKLKIPKENAPQADVDARPTGRLNTDEELNEPSDSASAVKPFNEEEGDYLLYKVKTGDSFYALKRSFNVERQELLRLNPELEAGLEVGKYIIIPKQKKVEKVSWLDRLFSKVEEKEETAPVGEKTKDLKQSLNTLEAAPTKDTNLLKAIDLTKTYRVALMLPFNASKALAGNTDSLAALSGISKMSLEFYQGFLLAAQAMADSGMNLSLEVYDSELSLKTINSHLQEIQTKQMDLLIGPALKKNVEHSARFLKESNIPVISPLSNAVEVAGLPNLIQAVPDLEAKDARIAQLLNEQFDEAKLIFAHDGKAQALARSQRIKARLSPRLQGNFVTNFVFNGSRFGPNSDFSAITRLSYPTVVVALSQDQAFLGELTRRLYALRSDKIYLIGSAKLTHMETVELDYLNRLKFIAAEVLHTNYSDSLTQNFIAAYRKAYQNEPSKFALQGYDVGLFFLKKLWVSGLFLRQNLSGTSIQTTSGFQMVQTPKGGLENQFLFITGVRNLEMVRLNEKEKPSVEKKKPLGSEER